LVAADSVSWRIYKNPISLYIGGAAAVILELAEPSISEALWTHSSFREDPAGRLRRTALAAMITVYGARSVAEPMIAGVTRMHAKIQAATDPSLLAWVQATAAFSFGESYSRYVHPLSHGTRDVLYHEGMAAARLYGAHRAPGSVAQVQASFEEMQGTLSRSPAIFEFLNIMRRAAIFPRPARWLQVMLLRAAVDIVPAPLRTLLGLHPHGLRRHEERWVRMLARFSDRVVLCGAPASQSCLRLGLPAGYLYAQSYAPPEPTTGSRPTMI